MFNKKPKKILLINHPYIKGYARLVDKNQELLVRSYIDCTYIDSKMFEQLQEKMHKDNITLQWK